MEFTEEEKEDRKMSAVKKGILGLVIGAVVVGIFTASLGECEVLEILVYTLVGAFCGFGFAFGWDYVKKAVSFARNICSGSSWGMLLAFVLVPIAISLGVLPGVVNGIICIVRELQGKS